MSIIIKKIKLKNFKKFESYQVEFNNDLNILIGDNEVGKSTILQAIDLVICGSLSKLHTLGIENLFNVNTVSNFLNGSRDYSTLPELHIELFLDLGTNLNPDLNGVNHSEKNRDEFDGLYLKILPDDNYSSQILEIISNSAENFPFEYYRSEFSTFGGKPYNGYKKYIDHLLIDSTQINSEYAVREYIKTVFSLNSDILERNKLQNLYRQERKAFKSNFETLNSKLIDSSFLLKNDSKSSLESNLTLSSNDVVLEHHGNGKQAIIKTEFALTRTKKNLDLILLEEPENHLSHTNTSKLIKSISNANGTQIFISTHSSLIATRLELTKAIVLPEAGSKSAISLSMLPDNTSKFFIKAPNHKVLEFILSPKVILVEGDAEYILLGEFYKKITNRSLDDDKVHVIEVGGKCFKRYLDLANLIRDIKVAVLTDNDGDHQTNCIDNYLEYGCLDNIKIFAETDSKKSTFEISLYKENVEICDKIFSTGRKTLSVQEYMLNNKTESAFNLALNNKVKDMATPQYIKEAITWINT